MTFNQLCRKKKIRKIKKPKSPLLGGNPQRKLRLSSVYTTTPKKPNSANRKAGKGYINIVSHEKRNKTKKNKTHPANRFKKLTKSILVYFPGEKAGLQEHNVILIKGNGAQDTPGHSRYSAVRGALDFGGVEGRKTSRSLYGAKSQ